MRVFQVLSVAALSAVALCQQPQQQQHHGQAPQATQGQQQAPQAAQPRHLPPAAVHFVNIGEKLEGDYKFGYDTGKGNENGQSFREETRLPDGTVKGAYGFIDASGKMRIIRYTAGKDGFKAEGDIYQDGAPANTPGLNGPTASAAPTAAPTQPRAAPVAQYQPQPAPRPTYQPQPQYQPPSQYRPQQPSYQTPAAPTYTPQTIQYRPQPQTQSGYPQYASQAAPSYAPQYAYPTSVSGGYRQPSSASSGLYASAQTNAPQRLQPAFPEFFRSASPAQAPIAQYQASPAQYQAPSAQYQAPSSYHQPQYQPQYRSPVSAAPVAPVQSYAATPQVYRQPAPAAYNQAAAPQYQQQAVRQPAPVAAPAATYGPAPTNAASPKKKNYEDGQYDPELTKAGLYYPELYEKLPSSPKDARPKRT